jgi:hypothetical protein
MFATINPPDADRIRVEHEGRVYEAVGGNEVLVNGQQIRFFLKTVFESERDLRLFAEGYHAGYVKGENIGRSVTQHEIRRALGV